jgi:hypothetical protein
MFYKILISLNMWFKRHEGYAKVFKKMGHMKVPWYKNIETHEGPKVLRKSGTHEGPKVLKKIYMMST